MKRVIALLLVLTIGFALCACGVSKKQVEEDLQGGWEYSWYASAVGIYCFCFYEFDDGDVTYTFIRGNNTEVKNGTYKISGKKIVMNIEGTKVELTYKYDDDTLILIDKGDGSINNVYSKFS